jgi:hypothetical protein
MSKRKDWAAIISDWKKSGLPISQYCLEKGLNRSNFFLWRKRLEKEGVNFESFIPVKFIPEKKKTIGFSIRIGENIRVEAENNFDAGQLFRVIEALEKI